MTIESFAIRLLQAESAARINSAELARRMKVRHSVVSQLERGRFNPGYLTLIKIACALDVSTDYLCGLTNQMRPAKE